MIFRPSLCQLDATQYKTGAWCQIDRICIFSESTKTHVSGRQIVQETNDPANDEQLFSLKILIRFSNYVDKLRVAIQRLAYWAKSHLDKRGDKN
ncbi:unnamed protein product [Pieris macdunnoughi]|uniref:Uncharacterized protein n=1 Tax=Pieris macdunnoughi TaxID=345717 RepID=A0A821NVV2_9NEOP|nr:unnamed protein product [Pieris macdunnoughi]